MAKPETESQKSHAKEFRPGTRLDPSTGNETVRTGRITPNRDIQPGIDVDDDDIRGSQNASGGRSNR